MTALAVVLGVAALALIGAAAVRRYASVVVRPDEVVAIQLGPREWQTLHSSGRHWFWPRPCRMARVDLRLRTLRVRTAWQVRSVDVEVLAVMRYRVRETEVSASLRYADVDKAASDLLHLAVGRTAPALRVPAVAKPENLAAQPDMVLVVEAMRDRMGQDVEEQMRGMGLELVDLELAATRV